MCYLLLGLYPETSYDAAPRFDTLPAFTALFPSPQFSLPKAQTQKNLHAAYGRRGMEAKPGADERPAKCEPERAFDSPQAPALKKEDILPMSSF